MAHLLDVLVKSEGREEIRVLLDVGAQVSTESTEQRYDCCLWGRSPGEESNFFTDAIKENWDLMFKWLSLLTVPRLSCRGRDLLG